MSERLDAAVVAHGYATGRDKAKELIRDGHITVNGTVITKPSHTVGCGDAVLCTVDTSPYVGRGGLKLEAALQALLPLPSPCVAMDVGASTGGFTHCMLTHGVSTVYAVDVGHGQLHPSLVSDPRVVNLEGCDVRDAAALSAIAPASIDLLTMDVSFISIGAVLPSLPPYLKRGARMLILIKPQFEAGKHDIGKNGIVKDPRVHLRVLREVCDTFQTHGCALQSLSVSPITGGAGRQSGNIEYVASLIYGAQPTDVPDLRRLTEEAFAQFR